MNKPTPITAEQIARFFEGRCTPEEVDAISRYLQENPEALRESILPDWKEAEAGGALPDGYRKEMFEAIQDETGVLRRGKVAVMRRVMIGAAAAVFLLAVAVWLLWPSRQAEVVKIATPVHAEPVKIAASTMRVVHSKGEEKILLPDGSTVVLYAGSTLRYPESFDTNGRVLTLEGKALFTVAKDEARPFVVTAGDVETTVLGTEFSVVTNQAGVVVRLYNGKVRLHAKGLKWKKDIVLIPGEQLDYMEKGALAVVSRWDKEEEEPAEVTEPVVEQELVFDNEALPQVMDKLASCYHLNIAYNKKQIGNMYFTGTVLTSDSLTTILHVIANMNELIIVPGKKGYTIRKQVP
ncbi:MAG: FecR domain-containing protein [Bacteroidetes bacterium]|nr:FecR domain-containing protein [Bacteroidota bacterium]